MDNVISVVCWKVADDTDLKHCDGLRIHVVETVYF